MGVDAQDSASERPVLIGGWLFTGLATAALLAMAAAILLTMGAESETIRLLIRVTGRTSLVFFCLAFGAAAIAKALPTPATAWLRSNRRYLGLSFVMSHLIHAGALIAFSRVDPAGFATATNLSMYVFGGLGYVFVILMGATSFDSTAALFGPRRWRMLHLIGGYYLWVIFLQAEVKRAADPTHWPLIILLLAVLAMRLLGHRLAFRPRPTPA